MNFLVQYAGKYRMVCSFCEKILLILEIKYGKIYIWNNIVCPTLGSNTIG
jgi:hypothetical protein